MTSTIVPVSARVATFTTNGGFVAFRFEIPDRTPMQLGLQAELLFDFHEIIQEAATAYVAIAPEVSETSLEAREVSHQGFLSEPIVMIRRLGYQSGPTHARCIAQLEDGSDLEIVLSLVVVRQLFVQIDFAVKEGVLIDLRPFIGKSWQEMHREFIKLPALKIDDRLRAFDFSLELFRRHSRSLIQHLEALSGPLTVEQASWQRRHAIEMGTNEAMFRLFDFLSADDALVNHSGVYYKKFYGSQGLIPTYVEEISKRFKGDGLSKFFDDLRNLMMHKGPIGPTHRRFPMRPEGRYVLDRELLLSAYSKWSAPAKEFLKSGPPELDLLELVRARVKAMEEFQEWFDGQRHAIHGRELHEAELIRRAVLARRGLTDMQSLLGLAKRPDSNAKQLQQAFSDYLTAEEAYELRDLEAQPPKWMEAALVRAYDRYYISDEFRRALLSASCRD